MITLDEGIKTLYLLGTDIDRVSRIVYTKLGLITQFWKEWNK